MQHYYVDANGCAATPGAPEALTRREAIREAIRAACHAGDIAVIIRADSVEERGPNVHWHNGHVVRAFRGDSPLVQRIRGGMSAAFRRAARCSDGGWSARLHDPLCRLSDAECEAVTA